MIQLLIAAGVLMVFLVVVWFLGYYMGLRRVRSINAIWRQKYGTLNDAAQDYVEETEGVIHDFAGESGNEVGAKYQSRLGVLLTIIDPRGEQRNADGTLRARTR